MQKAHMSNHRKAILFLIISAFSGSLFTLFSKIAMREEMIFFVMMMRFLLPFLLLLPFFIWIRIWRQVDVKNLPNQILRASLVTLGQYAFFFYLTKASLLNANVLISSSPIYMPLIARFIYGQRFSQLGYLSSFIGLIGVIFVIKPTTDIFSWYSLLGVFSGFSVAFSYVLFGINRKDYSLEINLFFFFFLCSCITAVIFLISLLFLEYSVFIPASKSLFFPLLIIGISSILNQLFRGMGYKLEKPAVLAPLLYLSVAFSGIYQWLLWNEVPSISTVIGSLLIFFSSLLTLFKGQ